MLGQQFQAGQRRGAKTRRRNFKGIGAQQEKRLCLCAKDWSGGFRNPGSGVPSSRAPGAASDNGVPRPGAAPNARGAVGFSPQNQLHCWDLFFRAEYHSGRMVRSVTIRSSSCWRGSKRAAPRAPGRRSTLAPEGGAPVRGAGRGARRRPSPAPAPRPSGED